MTNRAVLRSVNAGVQPASAITERWEVKPLLRPENANNALGIHNGVRQHPVVGLLKRYRMDLQELGGIVVSIPAGHKSLSEKQSDRPCGEPNRGIEGAQLEQPARAKPDLLLALPPGGCRRRSPGSIMPAGIS